MLTISKGVSIMKIALIAHDRKKTMMVKLATAYKTILEKHELFATGTTGGSRKQPACRSIGLNPDR